MQFRIEGRVIPYVRMTRRGKYVNPRAQLYLSSKAAIGYQYTQQMAQNDWQPFGKESLHIEISILTTGSIRTYDLDNAIKAYIDAGNKIVWFDDRYIDKIIAYRAVGEDELAIIKIGRLHNE